jgi:hypothetical protein
MAKADALLERIEAFYLVEGKVVIRTMARGYSLFSARNGAPIARLRPTGEANMVQVLWWFGGLVERRTLGHLRCLRYRYHAT